MEANKHIEASFKKELTSMLASPPKNALSAPEYKCIENKQAPYHAQ